MDQAHLVRSLRFRAHHHYWKTQWSEDRNLRVFGDQSRPHEHEWTVEVHVRGTVDPDTGWCVDLGALDAAIAEATEGWDGGDLNVVVPAVADGSVMPSTESLARWLFNTLGEAAIEPALVVRVGVHESPDLGSFYPAAGV